MSEAYRIPKREVTAEVTVIGKKPATLKIFLSQQAKSHTGYERPSDLLNGIDTFFPALDEHGDLVLLQRDAVKVVSVAADYETESDGSDPDADDTVPATKVEIEVTLDDGTTLEGNVEYVMPEGRARLQDFLNAGDRFIALRQAEMVHLVNKLRIARVASS